MESVGPSHDTALKGRPESLQQSRWMALVYLHPQALLAHKENCRARPTRHMQVLFFSDVAMLMAALFPSQNARDVGAWGLWLVSWWGMKRVLHGDLGVYAVCFSLATHLRLPPPLGQLLPLPDFAVAWLGH